MLAQDKNWGTKLRVLQTVFCRYRLGHREGQRATSQHGGTECSHHHTPAQPSVTNYATKSYLLVATSGAEEIG